MQFTHINPLASVLLKDIESIVHLGAGPNFDPNNYDFPKIKNVILIDADSDACAELRRKTVGKPVFEIQQVLVQPQTCQSTFYKYSLPEFNGPIEQKIDSTLYQDLELKSTEILNAKGIGYLANSWQKLPQPCLVILSLPNQEIDLLNALGNQEAFLQWILWKNPRLSFLTPSTDSTTIEQRLKIECFYSLFDISGLSSFEKSFLFRKDKTKYYLVKCSQRSETKNALLKNKKNFEIDAFYLLQNRIWEKLFEINPGENDSDLIKAIILFVRVLNGQKIKKWEFKKLNDPTKLLIKTLLVYEISISLSKIKVINGDIRSARLSLNLIGKELSLCFEKIIGIPFQYDIAKLSSEVLNKNDKPIRKRHGRRNNILILDCGGHDGCSAIKFKLMEPDSHIISFEGNPELWKYYKELPCVLNKNLVYTFDGSVSFFLDPVDADGSTVCSNKLIDNTKSFTNSDCHSITAPCIDLPKLLISLSSDYSDIILKLDVEGAEYEILKKMLDDNSICKISKLYIEFHWQKMGLDFDMHKDIVTKVSKHVEINKWDASEFAVHNKGKLPRKLRRYLLDRVVLY